MLKWAVGQKNPTPREQNLSSNVSSARDRIGDESSCCGATSDRLHIASRRNSRGAVRKAAVRSLKRIKHDKENQPCLTPESVSLRTRDNSRLIQMALRDVSNSPDPYVITPRRHNFIKRRQSHPLNLISKPPNRDFSKSDPTNTLEYLKTYNLSEGQPVPTPNHLPRASTTSQKTPVEFRRSFHDSYSDITDVVDMRKPNSTLKSLLTMQIEYSPGPLTATQSLVTLRKRLTKSLNMAANVMTPQGIDNPLYRTLNSSSSNNNGITITCNDQSPTLEGLMEEKSIFEQVSNKIEFINSFKKENSRTENTMVSSLSQRLEWLRLNNSFNSVNLIKEGERIKSREERQADRDCCGNGDGITNARKRRDWDVLKRQKCVRRKIRKCYDGACRTESGFCCDKNKPKTQQKPKLIGLTLPLGIPSPTSSEDSGLSSLGLEGIHPLSSSPINKEDTGTLTEETLAKFRTGDESISTSLLVEKCSPSSICSSLRKRVNENGFEAKDAWSDEVVPLVKTPKLHDDPRFKEEKNQGSNLNCDFAFPSPLALVEKRSRSRRCLRFVSPGSSTCQRNLSSTKHLSSLSCPRLKDGREGTGEIELQVNISNDSITVHVGKGTNLSRPSGTGCNAYVKVALVPSTERTFFRTPVHRESSCPNFNEKFSFKFHPEDLNKQILVSVWHRDRDNRRSEFLGCVSLAVNNAIKKEISGSFRLVAQSGGSKISNHQQSVQSSSGPSTSGSQSMMARQSGNARLDEIHAIDEYETNSSPEKHCKSAAKKKLNDDSSFLRHLELEPINGEGGRIPFPEATAKGGRTPFTTTKQLTKQPNAGFGFSIAWVQPPRVERVEAGQPADRAGIRPGDYVVFVDRYNVVTMTEEQILQIIKSCGNELTLEIYRKTNQNGILELSSALPCPAVSGSASAEYNHTTRWSAACSAATSSSFEFTKRRLHLPQVAFTNEVTTQLNPEESRKKAIYQLLNKEQNYAINLQFGINRFLVPLTERKEFLNSTQHHVLFQNVEEILRLTEDTLDQVIQGELDTVTSFIGRLYFKRIPMLKVAYKRYCAGLKRADCLLAEKSKSTEFNRFCAEPSIPRKYPDLTTFLHKPLEHYRELFKLLQTILNLTKTADADHAALSKVVSDMQTSFREVTAGLMEPEVEGRPLLSVQDLESRLVFTRCKPFVLSTPGRQWIFGGDLSRVEGKMVHPFWALLFTDMLLFAKVSRDRVLFITEEPLSLLSVSQASFNIRKRANEFRLVVTSGETGNDSPANAKCGPDLVLSRTPKKNIKFRSVALRAPTPELKAVWQNLIQRQIIYLNTRRGLTPAGSPLDSPDPVTILSAATLDSLSLKRQVRPKNLRTLCLEQKLDQEKNSSRREFMNPFNEFIDHKCKQLSQTKTGKDGASYLADWIKDYVTMDNVKGPVSEELCRDGLNNKPREFEKNRCKKTVSSHFESSPSKTSRRPEEPDKFTEIHKKGNCNKEEKKCQTESRSGKANETVSVCQKCHKTCLKGSANKDGIEEEVNSDNDDDKQREECKDSWGPLMMLGMCGILPTIDNAMDPFAPLESPPADKKFKDIDLDFASKARAKSDYLNSYIGEKTDCYKVKCKMSTTTPPSSIAKRPQIQIIKSINTEEKDTPEDDSVYKALLPSTGLRRFDTLNSLEKIDSDDTLGAGEKRTGEKDSRKINTKTLNEKGGIFEKKETKPEVKKGEARETRGKKEKKEGDRDNMDEKIRPQETGDFVKGWTVRAGSYVAAKMAFFESLSGPDNSVTVHNATFLERYLKPSAENNLESSEGGTNTSSSGKGDEEKETSGTTSGDEIWGTPTSEGEFDDELFCENSNLSIFESPRLSIDTNDDTEHLMEDLLMSLPMLAVRTRGVSSRQRLETLLEEEDSEASTSSNSPKLSQEPKVGQGRGGLTKHQRDELIKSETMPRKSGHKDAKNCVETKSLDLDLKSHSNDNELEETAIYSPSFFQKFRFKKNVDRQNPERRRSKICKRVNSNIIKRNSATYGVKPLFKYLFSKDEYNDDDDDDDIPTTLQKEYASYGRNEQHLKKGFWKQLKRRKKFTEVPTVETNR